MDWGCSERLESTILEDQGCCFLASGAGCVSPRGPGPVPGLREEGGWRAAHDKGFLWDFGGVPCVGKKPRMLTLRQVVRGMRYSATSALLMCIGRASAGPLCDEVMDEIKPPHGSRDTARQPR